MVTRPGFHKTTSFDSYPEVLRKAIREIGQNFYVTRSFPKESIGNSEYWGLLARPADDFSVHLNADRELLFIFSIYENFEIRTLEAFDNLYQGLEQKRVDRSIRFLISGDKRIESIIQHYLSQNPEYPIIIPINLKKIEQNSSQILESIRRNYIVRDLFGYQNPLREETLFFGRQEQVNAVLDLAKSGQSSSIFGLRKSGKTSSVYAIMRRARAFEITPVFIDCQSPAIHGRRYNELLHYLMVEIRRAIGQNGSISLFDGSDATVAEAFRQQLNTITGQAKSKFLLIFDEIENISPQTASSPHWNSGRDPLLFWQNIRSFIQQDRNGTLAVCLVGTSPLLLESPKIDGVANPMYLFSQKRFLPAFSFEETKEMIDRLGFFMGIEIDSTKIARLQKFYGGHPFFIRQVCSNIHQKADLNRPLKISDKQIESAIAEFGGQLDTYLADILLSLKKLYPDEFGLLEAITKGDNAEVSEYGREAPELIDHLTGFGLVERVGEEVDIRYDSVKHALRRILANPDTRNFWLECMERRNRIEVDIRRELLHSSKSFSSFEWKSLLERQLSAVRFKALRSVEPRILFSKSESPLYWTDLISLLKSTDIFPYLGDRRSLVLRAMNMINSKGRGDSHAKEVSAEDAKAVRESFDVLEAEFQQPD